MKMNKQKTKRVKSLSDVKAICKHHGIKNSREYRERYKTIEGLPSHPERMFQSEWTSYSEFFSMPELLQYDALKEEVQYAKIRSKRQYIAWVTGKNDRRYPKNPEEAYDLEWENWFEFCGKEKPFKPNYIPKEYKIWTDTINEFMKTARGGCSKESHLCRFVRVFIEKHDKSQSPQRLLTKTAVNIKPFREELKKLSTDNHRRSMILAVNEFLEYIIRTHLTYEDEETGEIVRTLNARNPFKGLIDHKSVTSPIRTESTKPCLQYFFVRKAQDWIIPKGAHNFKDLNHLHTFDSDWIKVPKYKIDYSDPDCVVQKRGNSFFIWNPIDWIHTYALTKIPLRGRQIAYNDSGEGDTEIPDIGEDGNILWIPNTGPLAGTTKRQSFIKMLHDGHLGMHVTTNKTSNNGKPHSVPWIPEDLAYWLIRLRKWQQKFNPITEPTPWSKCKRTNLNESQKQSKGVNCFLFRAFGDFEPKNVAAALTCRLAAALYHIQPSNLELAKVCGNPYRLSSYKSKYTPHSMRVSLITAYIMELGMPVEVIMKVVGHSSIVMSIYYCKVSHTDIRERLEKAEKTAIKSQAEATQSAIEQNNIESVKNYLVGSNSDILSSLTNEVPAGNYVFRDYGICPFASSRCGDGGEEIGASKIHAPVPTGYLGSQNCLRCRHFITGPAFLGGIISITNEVLLEANSQSKICQDLQNDIEIIEDRINSIDREEYLANLQNKPFNEGDRAWFESKIRKLESEYESSAKKMDMLLCDLQSAYKLVQLCQSAADMAGESGELSLVKKTDSEIRIEVEESPYFLQLNEVCENATIYQCSNPSRAVIPRSQMLDKMAALNGLSPGLFMLSEDQQLVAGNQLVSLLKSRLSSWARVNQLVCGDIQLSDLIGAEKIERSEIELIVGDHPQLTS